MYMEGHSCFTFTTDICFFMILLTSSSFFILCWLRYDDNNDLLVVLFYRNIDYIDRDWNEQSHTLSSYPSTMEKKVTLLKYFRNYMSEHLVKVSHDVLIIKAVGAIAI